MRSDLVHSTGSWAHWITRRRYSSPGRIHGWYIPNNHSKCEGTRAGGGYSCSFGEWTRSEVRLLQSFIWHHPDSCCLLSKASALISIFLLSRCCLFYHLHFECIKFIHPFDPLEQIWDTSLSWSWDNPIQYLKAALFELWKVPIPCKLMNIGSPDASVTFRGTRLIMIILLLFLATTWFLERRLPMLRF